MSHSYLMYACMPSLMHLCGLESNCNSDSHPLSRRPPPHAHMHNPELGMASVRTGRPSLSWRLPVCLCQVMCVCIVSTVLYAPLFVLCEWWPATHPHPHAHMDTTDIDTDTDTDIHTHTHAHTHTRTHASTCTHAHTHTQMRARESTHTQLSLWEFLCTCMVSIHEHYIFT